jgi:cytochrome b561
MPGSNRFPIPVRNTAHRYGVVAQLLHWLVVALVAIQVALGMTAADLPISPTRLALLARHKSVGFLILGLMVMRFAWRLYSPPPPLPATMPEWQQSAARVSHGLLYATLFTMPLVGWASSSAANLTVSVFGWFQLPNLTTPDKDLAQTLIFTHVVMSRVLLATIILHVGAALWHHFVAKDDVLKRMLPYFRSTHGGSSQ